MKTTILLSLSAATMAANCIHQIAQDNGVTIPDQITNQLPDILITGAGLLSAFLGWLAHRNDKKAQNVTINSLVASNQKMAAESNIQTIPKPVQ